VFDQTIYRDKPGTLRAYLPRILRSANPVCVVCEHTKPFGKAAVRLCGFMSQTSAAPDVSGRDRRNR
jgi:hypothetical protein